MIRTSLVAVALAAVALAVMPAQAANRHVDIINKTGMDLKHFYASVASTNDWEEDILGRDVIADGETFDIDIDDGSGKCVYDFKAVFANGQSLVRTGINVCQIETFTYTAR